MLMSGETLIPFQALGFSYYTMLPLITDRNFRPQSGTVNPALANTPLLPSRLQWKFWLYSFCGTDVTAATHMKHLDFLS